MLTPTLSKPPGRTFSPTTKSRALAVVLAEEFGIPFRFYDALGGQEIAPADDDWRPGGDLLSPEAVLRLAAEGRPAVTEAGGVYRLALVLFEGELPILVAAGAVAPLASPGERPRERERLLKWLQAVSDRLRLREQLAEQIRAEEEQAGQLKRAWEVVFGFDASVRSLRIHRDPGRHRQALLRSARAQVDAGTLAWVPEAVDAEVQVEGAACLAPSDYRQLAAALARIPDLAPGKPVLWAEGQAAAWAGRFPAVASLAAFRVTDGHPVGWLLALNRRDPAGEDASGPFRMSDAAVLAPFGALLELHYRSSRRYRELKDLLVGLTRSLTAALDAKDTYTYGHSERVARIAIELGRELGLPEDELSDIYLAGLLHDIGKIGVRDTILRKTEPLTTEEMDELKKHVVVGHAILADLRQVRNLLPGVLHHHERIDGKGYPHGLAGEAIPLLARILAVADAYDAMSTRRPYRDALPCRQVEATLHQGAGTQWDARVVEALLRCRERVHIIRQRGVGESLYHALDGALRTGESSAFPVRLARLERPGGG